MTRQRYFFAAALLLALASGPRADETATAPEEPKPIFTRQGRFSIPFRVDAPADVAPPAKVRLFVSEDGGTRWHLDAEVLPSQQRFDFRSLHDGEYWFTIRSIDGQGRSYPDGAYEPQLRVVVDTLAPRLDLSATRGAGSEVTAHWDVVDTAVDPATFKLEYQIAGGAWQTLALAPDAQHVAKMTLVGETAWWPAAGGGRSCCGRRSPIGPAIRPSANSSSKPMPPPPPDSERPRDRRPAAGRSANRRCRGAEVGPVAGRDHRQYARRQPPRRHLDRRPPRHERFHLARGPARFPPRFGRAGGPRRDDANRRPANPPCRQSGRAVQLLARRRAAANGQSPLLRAGL